MALSSSEFLCGDRKLISSDDQQLNYGLPCIKMRRKGIGTHKGPHVDRKGNKWPNNRNANPRKKTAT